MAQSDGVAHHGPRTASEAIDELAIRSLISAYSDAVILRDPEAAGSVYAEDGVLEAFGGPAIEGRPAIVAALERRLGTGNGFSYQLMQTVRVDIDGANAWARSHYFEISGPTAGGHGRLSTGMAVDELKRTAEGWRIAHRSLNRSYVGDLDTPGKVTALPGVALGAAGP